MKTRGIGFCYDTSRDASMFTCSRATHEQFGLSADAICGATQETRLNSFDSSSPVSDESC